jgi:hypothetical protein
MLLTSFESQYSIGGAAWLVNMYKVFCVRQEHYFGMVEMVQKPQSLGFVTSRVALSPYEKYRLFGEVSETSLNLTQVSVTGQDLARENCLREA